MKKRKIINVKKEKMKLVLKPLFDDTYYFEENEEELTEKEKEEIDKYIEKII